ncbi:hypothetical protein ACKWRH_06410 [Bradyrhizobium sp. Pa8]|uniref:hypothetical protein n=1 Tax=Bradyrhizobium sp. Pa8 TaxID=3386552 RepID=UPI00403F9E8A
MVRFDLDRIAAAQNPERELQFQFLGLQTLYHRDLLHVRGKPVVEMTTITTNTV